MGGGGIFFSHREEIAERATAKNILAAWMVFALLFVGVNLLIQQILAFRLTQDFGTVLKVGLIEVRTFSKAVLGWSGIIALYLTSVYYCKRHQVGKTIIKIGTCGYGVYVFHQFILVFLYRHTELPHYCGTYWLPWVGFGVTVAASVLLTLAVRSTRIGRKYL